MDDLSKIKERYEALLEILSERKISEIQSVIGSYLTEYEDEKYTTRESIIKAIDLYIKEKKFFDEAHSWQCECGQICDPMSGLWRWQGQYWEHYHGYPIGHVRAAKSIPVFIDIIEKNFP